MKSSSGRSLFDRYFSYIDRRKPSDKLLFRIAGLCLIVSVIYSLYTFNSTQKVTIPTEGGVFSEGIIGTPRFVNPVLAITRADHDISSLVYSGLMRLSPEGNLQPDLAESITVSDDGLVYNVVLKDNIIFHDGVSLTAEDVAFTVHLIQDPNLKSPLRGNWNDVTVEVLGEHELNFVLQNPYTPFMENLHVGILPKHIWGGLSIEQLPFSQHNTEPVGTGPYKIESIKRNNSGLIDFYTLSRFHENGYNPKIEEIVLRFYQNETELLTGLEEGVIIATAGLSYSTQSELKGVSRFVEINATLPRVFSVFFNQNRSTVLRDEAAREALSVAIDREALVQDVLYGYGVPSDRPIPQGFLPVESNGSTSATSSLATSTNRQREAETILLDGGWEKNENGIWEKEIDDSVTTLSITLASANSEIFERTAAILENTWKEIGVDVQVELYEQSDLVQGVIRPRAYEALLFGIDVGRSLDFYPFWHSSQREDPGLNVALYTNITTDDLLETARTSQNEEERYAAIRSFESELQNETPAIFLFNPAFTYLLTSNVEIVPFTKIVHPSERFSSIDGWYMEHSDVWPIFAP